MLLMSEDHRCELLLRQTTRETKFTQVLAEQLHRFHVGSLGLKELLAALT